MSIAKQNGANPIKRICVFCGVNRGAKPAYIEAAQALGLSLSKRGLGLVYGGTRLGMMGAIADAVLAQGGEVIGVIPEFLTPIAHEKLTQLHVANSMHEQKQLMSDLADAFLALPGGFGTFDELCEIATWSQLGLHRKPCGVLNVEGYYDALLSLFDHAVRERFLHPGHRDMILRETDPDRMLDALLSHSPPIINKRLDGD
jgi:uncharacterized protein (TIGR00730 family)